ncbi:MAG TPA: TatD family hydrolase [Candidatus Paceibacterota bacterium]|nr:TatD family hydrolase [Candidatus Paceibacterota bacterium]
MKTELRTIDAHTHVQSPEFDLDRNEVILRALDLGIGMINSGADLDSSKKAVELTQKYENVWATVGIHPTENRVDGDWEEIKKLSNHPKVIAVGECGLDYFRDKEESVQKKQIELFKNHIDLSFESQKPLVIHCREAFIDMIDLLQSSKEKLLSKPGIFHFFTGTKENTEILLDMNFSFTFGGLITFNRSFDDLVRFIPLDHILVETDAPLVSPKSHRGQRNEPIYVTEVIKSIASIKNIPLQEVTVKILKNTKNVFNIV